MKRFLFLLLFTTMMLPLAIAQELMVKSMEILPMDLSASIHPRNDLNGKACALVKVKMPLEGAVFEGNVLGSVENKAGEYWLYMSEGTKQLRVKHPGFASVHVMFRDYGIKALESKVTYELSIVGNMQYGNTDINLKTYVLRNEGQKEELLFKNGDDLYLSFLSPVSGYLAVYLVDEDKHAYCLLPYDEQQEGCYRVEGNRNYLFFNKKAAESSMLRYVREYKMASNQNSIVNQLFVVFSPYQFFKAVDQSWDGVSPLENMEPLPRLLSEEDLQEWLTACQQRDKAMKVVIKHITISK